MGAARSCLVHCGTRPAVADPPDRIYRQLQTLIFSYGRSPAKRVY